MFKYIFPFFLFTFFIAKSQEEITIPELKNHISTLASEEFEGRLPGTKGDVLASEYIKDDFKFNGLKSFYDDYYQPFQVLKRAVPGKNNLLKFNGKSMELNKDFLPYAISSEGGGTGNVVFVGYGFKINKDSLQWDDYAGINPEGKWLFMLRGDPEPDNHDSKFLEYSDIHNKALIAKDAKALGILFVSGPSFDKDDSLASINSDRVLAAAGIPILHIKRAVADEILNSAVNADGTKGNSKKNIADLEKALNDKRKPASFETNVKVEANSNLEREMVTTKNVVAYLKGNKEPDSYIIIGAHYDHLGYGGEGSGSRNPDTIAVHYGADDNASGVATLLELAEKFAANKTMLKRSIIFVAFGAEEKGLLGSRYFVDSLPVAKEKIYAMINIDMVGRLSKDSAQLNVYGYGTAQEYESIFNGLKHNDGLKLNFLKEGYGPSDHASFYSINIPVLFFTTGAHPDYHLPQDTPDKINYEGQKTVSDFIYDVALELDKRNGLLSFQEAGPKASFGHYRRFKVTLGIMPDFTNIQENGLGVDGVREGTPAGNGGMKKGDIITAINGKPVGNIYEYMFRLKELKPGDTITVDIIRNKQRMVLLIQL